MTKLTSGSLGMHLSMCVLPCDGQHGCHPKKVSLLNLCLVLGGLEAINCDCLPVLAGKVVYRAHTLTTDSVYQVAAASLVFVRVT